MTTIFVHIPKTAGTTIRHQLAGSYRKEEVRLVYPGEKGFVQPDELLAYSANELRQVRFIHGHFDHSIAEAIPCCDPIYATILRNPVARVVSLYQHFMLQHLKLFDVSLKQAIADKVTAQLYNHQTRLLSGREFDQESATTRSGHRKAQLGHTLCLRRFHPRA